MLALGVRMTPAAQLRSIPDGSLVREVWKACVRKKGSQHSLSGVPGCAHTCVGVGMGQVLHMGDRKPNVTEETAISTSRGLGC